MAGHHPWSKVNYFKAKGSSQCTPPLLPELLEAAMKFSINSHLMRLPAHCALTFQLIPDEQ